MATITLPGFTFGCAMGMGAFEGIGTAFTSVKSSSGGLSGALGTLKSKIDLAMAATKVETSQEQVKKAENRESAKKSSLSLAYEKLNTLISDTGSVDMKASSKIRERKDAFYDRYYYLKPECEKNKREKVKDALKKGWEGLCSIGNAIKNFAMDVLEWCKEHWKLIATAIMVVVAIVVIVATAGMAGPVIAFIAAAAKGLILGAVIGGLTSGVMTGISTSRNGGSFFDGFCAGFEEGAFSGAISGAITGGAGSHFNLMGSSFWGSVGKNALFGATTNATSSAATKTIEYWVENGTLKGAGKEIWSSTVRGAISGGIFGGILGGAKWIRFDANNAKFIQDYKKTSMETLRTQLRNNVGSNAQNNLVYDTYNNIKDVTAFRNFLYTESSYKHGWKLFIFGNESADSVIQNIFDEKIMNNIIK